MSTYAEYKAKADFNEGQKNNTYERHSDDWCKYELAYQAAWIEAEGVYCEQ